MIKIAKGETVTCEYGHIVCKALQDTAYPPLKIDHFEWLLPKPQGTREVVHVVNRHLTCWCGGPTHVAFRGLPEGVPSDYLCVNGQWRPMMSKAMREIWAQVKPKPVPGQHPETGLGFDVPGPTYQRLTRDS
jgi:hypothetical protein